MERWWDSSNPLRNSIAPSSYFQVGCWNRTDSVIKDRSSGFHHPPPKKEEKVVWLWSLVQCVAKWLYCCYGTKGGESLVLLNQEPID